MKQFRVLFMLLIGMIGFTAMASTPLTEQKQKIEIVKDFQVQSIADNVLSFELVSVDTDTIYLQSNEAHILRIVTEPFNTLAIITDVGWHSSKQPFKKIPYTEKLLENYNLHFRNSLSANKENRIRENPFRTQTLFRITRTC